MTRNPTYDGRADPVDVPMSTYANFVRRHLVLLTCTVLIGGMIGAAAVVQRTPRWTSTATVLLTSAPAAVPSWVPEAQPEPLPPTVDTEAQLVESQQVARAVGRHLADGVTLEEIRDAIAVTAPAHTRLLRISVTARHAAQAEAGALAAANAYLAQRRQLENQMQEEVVRQLQLHAAALRRTIDELPPRGVVARPRDPNQRRRAVLGAITSVEDRIDAIRDSGNLPGQRVSVSPAVNKTRVNRTVPPVSGTVAGLLCGVLLGIALDLRRRPRELPQTQVPWTSSTTTTDGLRMLRHVLSQPAVGPIVCIEGVDSNVAVDELAMTLAAQLDAAGLHVSVVSGEATTVVQGSPADPEHEPPRGRYEEDRSLRRRVLSVWLTDPWVDRVVAAILDRTTTEELLTAPGAETLCSDVVLYQGPRTRLDAVQERRDRLRSIGGRVHLATGKGRNVRVELDLTTVDIEAELASTTREG